MQVQNWVQLYFSSHLWCVLIWICICLSWLHLEAWSFLWLKKQIIITTSVWYFTSEAGSKVVWSQLQRLFLSPAGFACRQGLVSWAASARHVLIATQKSRGHNPSGAVHQNYHLIKIKWWTDNWMSLRWLPRTRARGRVPFIHTNKSDKESAVGKEINLWHEHEQ